MAATLETMAEVATALLTDRIIDLVVWGIAGILIFLAAIFVERLKFAPEA